MEKESCKDKIRKLLALAESPNEHEARAALLKARQLMAEHKLIEAELKDVNTCSKRKNPWIVNLSAVIGENYCCKGYRTHGYKEQTQRIGFIGLKDDVDICITIFKYAVDCVLSEFKQIKKANAGYGGSSYTKKLCNSYGYGFTDGVQEAFRVQQEENEDGWGLVLLIPKEVKEASKHLGKQPFKAQAAEEIYDNAYALGYSEGKEFDPGKRIEEVAV